MNVFADMFDKMNKGMSLKQIEAEGEKQARKASHEKGKEWGVCESCENETALVEAVGLCGPCCFGEADTLNGNW